MKIFLDDSFVYPLLKVKGSKIIVNAEDLIAMINAKTTNPREKDVLQKIENIRTNTKADGTIELETISGSDYTIGHKKDEAN